MEEKNISEYLFASALNNFLIEINGISDTLPIIMESLGEDRLQSFERIRQFLEGRGEIIGETEAGEENGQGKRSTNYKVSLEYLPELKSHLSTLSSSLAASIIIPKSFLVAMVSQFDAFLGRLIKAMYYAKPDMLNDSKKPLTFADLVQFGSLDAAREYIIEKEVEAVLRESHWKHFEWLEAKLGIPLRKGLDSWPMFVEITERRNLFVHTDGEVSSHYINMCKKHDVNFEDDCDIGTKLNMNADYHRQAYETLFEVATKLTQVVWRKLNPSELKAADEHLNSICYDLLKEEKYKLTKKILAFALSLPRHSSQRAKLVFIINNAIAYKWGGEPEKAKKMISETDWSACSIDFQLANSVLLEEFDEAAEIMKKIGPAGEVKKVDYKDWPVFKDFRHTPQFLEAYKDVFGQILERVEISEGNELENELESEKEFLVRELVNSWSFSQTHSVIGKLGSYTDFSAAQINHIVAVAVSNHQICWIITDPDVRDFLYRIIKGRQGEIDPDYLKRLYEELPSLEPQVPDEIPLDEIPF